MTISGIKMIALSNFIGLLGVVITLIAYFLLNIRKISSRSFIYATLNAIGSALVLYSLCYAWNLAAFSMEFIWLLISFYGMYQAICQHLKDRSHSRLKA